MQLLLMHILEIIRIIVKKINFLKLTQPLKFVNTCYISIDFYNSMSYQKLIVIKSF